MDSQQDRPEELRLPEERVRELAQENIIVATLIQQEARRRVSTVPESRVKQRIKELQKQYGGRVPVEEFRSRIEDQVRVDQLYREIFKSLPKITLEAAKEAYDRDPGAYALPEQVHCSHIVRHTFGGADPNKSLQEILEAQRLLRSGRPFEAVARQFSDSHGQAGDLGTFPRGRMVDKFDNVVFRLKPGEISDVFQTEFGYHIVLLHETTPGRSRSFEEARQDVVRDLKEAQRRNAIDALAAELRQNAKIEEE